VNRIVDRDQVALVVVWTQRESNFRGIQEDQREYEFKGSQEAQWDTTFNYRWERGIFQDN